MTTQMKGNSSMSNLLWLWSTINLPSEKEDSCSPRANHNNGNNNRNNPSPPPTHTIIYKALVEKLSSER